MRMSQLAGRTGDGTAVIAWLLLSVLGAHAAEPSGIAVFGQQIYQARCSNCHSNAPGKTIFAPTLFGLIGREAGSIEGFPYTEKIARLDLVWTPESLNAWLFSINLDSPLLRMRHLGVENDDDRAALIAYIATLKN